MGITDDKQKRALLLHYAGPSVDEIFDTLDNTGEDKDYKKAIDKLTEYFSPQTNIAYEVYNFRQAKQKEGESLDSYHTRLRQLSKTCEFADTDKEIKEHIILSCSSNSLRRRALRENPDLASLLKLGRALELSESQANKVERNESTINAVNEHKGFQRSRQSRPQRNGRSRSQTNHHRSLSRSRSTTTRNNSTSQECRNCGGHFPHKTSCPAKGKDCKACGKIGHFARVCRTNPPKTESVKHITQDTDDEYEYVYSVNNQGNKQPPTCKLQIEGKTVDMMIDSGASVNLIDETTFQVINDHRGKILEQTNNRIYPYGSTTPLPLLGTITANIKAQTTSTKAQLHVVKGNTGNLLSYKTAQQLGLLKISVNAATIANKNSPDCLQEEFKCLFGGIGKVKGKTIQLHIDSNVKPKQQPHRRIPFHVRADVEKELERLEKLDIIETVEGPTPWVSPVVVVPKKSGEVRICVDMREANQAVKREKHLMPTTDDLVADLNGATLFSTLDLSSGYHQLELAPESRHITTFSTHVGLRRYKRLLFGINAASEIFQNAIEELLTGLPGCKNISDDIIVFGKDQEDHDKNLRGVLQRLQEYNVRLNKDKCSFSKTEVMFYGHVFSAEGIKPDPKKVEAIKSASPPQNASEVKSLLGMAQYVSRYIPEYATITAPLRALTRQDASWKWEQEEQRALDNLREALTGDRVMSYFDPRKKVEVIVDASPVGLGGLLVQEGKVISYASRALSDVESRYSQTEREMLATVWGAEHFHLYVYGAQFSIITDHKPLLGIFKSHKQTSARIDRWKLRLMPYDCQLLYRPGRDAENPDDFMSRHPSTSETERQNIAEDYVNYICNNAIPKAMTLPEVKLEIKKDQAMQALIKAIESDQWSDQETQVYRKIKDELSVCNGIVLRGNRIVIPTSLRSKAIDLAHIGHQGIVKTKRLLREKVWFPGIDKMAEEKIHNCLPCQASTQGKMPPPEPLKMTPLPSAPWKEVAIDFVGPFPTGDYIMVVIDEYSRFPEVETLTSTSARAVIPKLDAIFARQGIPEVLKSDNGPPFFGHEFRKFTEYLGFEHRKITPYWPKANGEAERFMQTIEKCIRTANTDGKNWKQEMHKFLRQYRATPHSTTDISPSEALNQRKLKTTLPELAPVNHSVQSKIAKTDADKKLKMKIYADAKAHARETSIKPGEVVLMRQPKCNKLSTPYNPKPFVVEAKKGTMVTVSNGPKTITRNSSQFKVIPKHLMKFEEDEEEEEETATNPTEPTEPMPAEPAQDLPETTPLRRSNRQIKPPVRFSDYVRIVYLK